MRKRCRILVLFAGCFVAGFSSGCCVLGEKGPDEGPAKLHASKYAGWQPAAISAAIWNLRREIELHEEHLERLKARLVAKTTPEYERQVRAELEKVYPRIQRKRDSELELEILTRQLDALRVELQAYENLVRLDVDK